MKEWWQSSTLSGVNAEYLEMQLEKYLADPSSVETKWRDYFSQLSQAQQETSHKAVQEEFKNFPRQSQTRAKVVTKQAALVTASPSTAQSSPKPQAKEHASTVQPTVIPQGIPPRPIIKKSVPLVESKSSTTIETKEQQTRVVVNQTPAATMTDMTVNAHQQAMVQGLIDYYRNFGHRAANLDPLGLTEIPVVPRLTLERSRLENSLETIFDVGTFKGLKGQQKLSAIVDALKKTYCSSIGFEYMHISDEDELNWLTEQIETTQATPSFSKSEKETILQKLTAAEGLEKYLGRKYVGQKRFSLEGGDSLIPLLYTIITHAGNHFNLKEIIMGMPHRGRLNVLVNILGKLPTDLFFEFEGKNKSEKEDYAGDVKYHLGFSSNLKIDDKTVHLAMAFNPSHLEIVSPVVEGSVRARQRRREDWDRQSVLPIIMHGDAAFAGQGVVMETFAMSQSRGFSVGGTIHIVVNNQIGFTTDPSDSRSSHYCTDVAKMIESPIFHVNADDPEAVTFVARLATEYRMKFKKDVVIDLVCFRRHGHNESDEPSATQPLMYKVIKKQPTTRKLYADYLTSRGELDASFPEKLMDDYLQALNEGVAVAEATHDISTYEYAVSWQAYLDQSWRAEVDTSIPVGYLERYSQALHTFPDKFELQPQVKKIMQTREKMAAGEQPIDWGFAETLAYASLLDEGYPIRLCGQDSGRGTFAHRHAILHNQVDNAEFMPLQHISKKQASIIIINSLLSEEAVLAFEYGFSTAEPDNLVIWEAQFGDFANGAQVVIDQFIASGEQKWGRLSGLVMFLPHGYEGMGAEHSSARLERYLQLCAQENIQVCVPTTASQIFHLLRRQMLRPYRKPLVVLTPKSLLRHKLATSTVEDLTNGKFSLVIPEVDDILPKDVKRVVICTGKIYYDLLQARRANKIKDVAIIRIEQLYPFPEFELSSELSRYAKAKDVLWCQEEPLNQGAWYSLRHHFISCLAKHQSLNYLSRRATAAPAVGLHSLHLQEQEALVQAALKINTTRKAKKGKSNDH
ncbi:MAG: 2-oxoglutarate dehydrogenase E1 component [Gammaproteobacteria bacterium]